MIYLLGGYMWLYVHRPFEVWPWLGALQLERAYMLLLILAWLVHPGKGLMATRIHAALFLFTLALISAYLLSPYAGAPGCYEVVDNYAKVAVFYVIVTTTVRDEKNLRLLILLFLGAVGLYMGHSIFEFINGRYQWRMGIRRMIGVDATYSDPNAFATTLLYSLPLLLPFWLEQPRRIPRWVIIGYLLAALGCIMLTGSRAGFMGVCVLVFILIITSAKRKAQALVLMGAAGVVGLLVMSVALPEELQNRYLTLVDSSKGPENAQVSASGRLDGFVHGIAVWQQSPLFGHGPSSFAYATGRGGQAHNLYGQVLSELGLNGAVALLALVVCFFWNWIEARRRAGRESHTPLTTNFPYQVSRAVGINVILLLVMGWAGHNLFRYNWQWFAAFSAIALYCLRLRAASGEQAAYAVPADPYPVYHPQFGYYTHQG
jgi:O-antigen ligase